MSLEKIVSVLKLAEPFRSLSEEQYRLIGFVCDVRKVAKSNSLYGPNDVLDGAYVLASGEVQVSYYDENIANKVISEPGTTIGELALIIENPQPIKTLAVSDAEFVFVPRSHFKRLVQSYPDLAEKIGARIRATMNEYVQALESAHV